MSDDGWIALLDVSCFISGNLNRNSLYHDKVKAFEMRSYQTGLYDFDFGAKMQGMLKDAQFEIVHFDNDVSDPELNFSGSASEEVIEGWSARLKRMKKLSEKLGLDYMEFREDLLASLRSETHEKRGNVKFVVAKKLNRPNDSGIESVAD